MKTLQKRRGDVCRMFMELTEARIARNGLEGEEVSFAGVLTKQDYLSQGFDTCTCDSPPSLTP